MDIQSLIERYEKLIDLSVNSSNLNTRAADELIVRYVEVIYHLEEIRWTREQRQSIEDWNSGTVTREV